MPAARSGRARVLLLCSGLDHAHRGFESFARECFEALRGDPALDLSLVKATGRAAPGERVVGTLTRDAPVARALGRAWRREAFRVEQVAFGVSVLPLVARERPRTIFLSEWHTALVLAAYRRLSRQRFDLVLCNGTMAVERFGHLDRVQQLTPVALDEALRRGDDPARHVLLPLGFAIDPAAPPLTPAQRDALRTRLDLPVDRPVLISVAALNRHHKRIDYLIEEVARLGQPRPFLLLVGQAEAETAGIRRMAADRLGRDGHSIRTVAHERVGELLRAADVFVLASLGEGLPRALIEALGAGLPCLAHDYEVTRFALGPHGALGDLSRTGGLAALLADQITRGDDGGASLARRRFAFQRFGWERLRPRYVELLTGHPVTGWADPDGDDGGADPGADPFLHSTGL